MTADYNMIIWLVLMTAEMTAVSIELIDGQIYHSYHNSSRKLEYENIKALSPQYGC